MLKKLFISIFLLFILFNLICQENFKIIKRGDKAENDGVIITEEKFRELIEIEKKSKEQDLKIFELKSQNEILKERITLWETKYSLLDEKFQAEMNRRIAIETKYDQLNKSFQIVMISHNVAWSISIAELIGVGTFAGLWYAFNH